MQTRAAAAARSLHLLAPFMSDRREAANVILLVAALLLVLWTGALLANVSAGGAIIVLPFLSLALIIYSLLLGRQSARRRRDA